MAEARPSEKVPFVGCETLTWFFNWCHEHGIPGSPYKLKSGLIAGVFAPAAMAVPRTYDSICDEKYDFFIFPARLERWAEENAIDYR